MKSPKIIIGVILLSLILSEPTYAGAKNDKININIYAKLVDCLEKCLIYGHIRRFAN